MKEITLLYMSLGNKKKLWKELLQVYLGMLLRIIFTSMRMEVDSQNKGHE